MASDDIIQQLHDRATRGESLSQEEQTQLEAWYACEDSAESKELGLTPAEKTPSASTVAEQRTAYTALPVQTPGRIGNGMQAHLVNLTYQVELQPGEELTLPESLVKSIGAGSWLVTIQPLDTAIPRTLIRDHSAFLNSYAPEDEGLYDDYPSR